MTTIREAIDAAHARLGAVRDKMNREEVGIIQDFLEKWAEAKSKPDLIYYPWPSGIDGITGVIGPRGDIPKGTGFIAYGDNGTMVPNRYFLNGTKQVDGVSFRFPADAELTWVRSEDEVPQELLREAHNRDKLEES